jgi:hypothetical protein
MEPTYFFRCTLSFATAFLPRTLQMLKESRIVSASSPKHQKPPAIHYLWDAGGGGTKQKRNKNKTKIKQKRNKKSPNP